MIDRESAAILFVVFLIVVALLIGFVGGADHEYQRFKAEAVKAGAATYETDENGLPVFKWKKSE